MGSIIIYGETGCSGETGYSGKSGEICISGETGDSLESGDSCETGDSGEFWAKLQFTGTTSWCFNQQVDKNINNWHKYQVLMKISKVIDKNVNSWKCDYLTRMSILTKT